MQGLSVYQSYVQSLPLDRLQPTNCAAMGNKVMHVAKAVGKQPIVRLVYPRRLVYWQGPRSQKMAGCVYVCVCGGGGGGGAIP